MKNWVRLHIGTYGWIHQEWEGSFYPDDLPSSWQLDYFGNIFDVVLVPQAEWEKWSLSDMIAVKEGLEPRCKMYLALQQSSMESWVRLPLVFSVFDTIIPGVVIWSEQPFYQTHILCKPVTLISTYFRLPGWSWYIQGVWLSGQPFGFVAELPKKESSQVQLLTDFVESLPSNALENSDIISVAWIVGGVSVNVQQVMNLKVISELMGY